MAKTHFPAETARVMEELSRADRRLARVIRRVGTFPNQKRKSQHPFVSLFRAIVYQQITGKAAEAILNRVKTMIARDGFPTPEEILRASKVKLRRAGLSRQKIAAAKDLAAKTLDGTVPPLAKLRRMDEEEIIERLTQVRGIGVWSVQMFLIFQLGRTDVLPIDDYGIRKGFARIYGHKEVPKPKAVLEHGERWRPYRSIASWYLWRAAEEKQKKPERPKKARKASASQ
jgi:DNA-3-methyladenine glycosylase II